jgi:DNA integrity scanning protein DisA with diadenylate cyclase activity
MMERRHQQECLLHTLLMPDCLLESRILSVTYTESIKHLTNVILVNTILLNSYQLPSTQLIYFVIDYKCASTCFDHSVVIFRQLKHIKLKLQRQKQLSEFRLRYLSLVLQSVLTRNLVMNHRLLKGTEILR